MIRCPSSVAVACLALAAGLVASDAFAGERPPAKLLSFAKSSVAWHVYLHGVNDPYKEGYVGAELVRDTDPPGREFTVAKDIRCSLGAPEADPLLSARDSVALTRRLQCTPSIDELRRRKRADSSDLKAICNVSEDAMKKGFDDRDLEPEWKQLDIYDKDGNVESQLKIECQAHGRTSGT